MYNCVQWPFVLNYSSRFGTVRVKVMRHLWRPICHWCSLDGWIDWDVYTVTVVSLSDGRSVVLPTVSPLTLKAFFFFKGAFH